MNFTKISHSYTLPYHLHQVKCWPTAKGEIKLFCNKRQGLHVYLSDVSIKSIFEGIPQKLHRRPKALASFLENTHIKISQIGRSHFKIYVHQRGLGGSPTNKLEQEVESYAETVISILKQIDFNRILASPDRLQTLDKLQALFQAPLDLAEGDSISEHLQHINQTLEDKLEELKSQTKQLQSLVNDNICEIGQLHALLAKKVGTPLQNIREGLEKNFINEKDKVECPPKPIEEHDLDRYCLLFGPLLVAYIMELTTQQIDDKSLLYSDIVLLEKALTAPFEENFIEKVKQSLSNRKELPQEILGFNAILTPPCGSPDKFFALFSQHVDMANILNALLHLNQLKWHILHFHSNTYNDNADLLDSLTVQQTNEMALVSSEQLQINDLKVQIKTILKQNQEIESSISTKINQVLEDKKLDEEVITAIKHEIESNESRAQVVKHETQSVEDLEKDLEALNELNFQQSVAMSTYD